MGGGVIEAGAPDVAATTNDWRQPIAGLRMLVRGRGPIRAVQVYGQRCSGTHAIIRLIEANFGAEAFTERFGFKHWFVPHQILFREDVLVLVIAREPYEWAQALHAQPWHVHPDLRERPFGEFIRHEWHSVWDGEFWGVDADHPIHGSEMVHERDPRTGDRFANAIAKRTAKLAHWSSLDTRAHNLALLDQRVLRARPHEVVAAIAAATGLRAADPFVAIDSYKGHGVRPYRPAVYPAPCEADRAHIRTWLDAEVEARFGFTL